MKSYNKKASDPLFLEAKCLQIVKRQFKIVKWIKRDNFSDLNDEEDDGAGDESVLVDASVAGGVGALQDCVAGAVARCSCGLKVAHLALANFGFSLLQKLQTLDSLNLTDIWIFLFVRTWII